MPFTSYSPKSGLTKIYDLPHKCRSFCMSNFGSAYLFAFTDGIYFYDYPKTIIITK